MEKGQGLFSNLPLLWWLKLFMTVCATAFAVVYSIPSLLGDPASWERAQPVGEETMGRPVQWYNRFAEDYLPSSRVSLGLDLKGGLHLVLEVDVEKSLRDNVQRAVNRARDLADKDGITSQIAIVANDFTTTIEISDKSKSDAFKKIVSEQTSLIQFDSVTEGQLKFVANSSEVERYTG